MGALAALLASHSSRRMGVSSPILLGYGLSPEFHFDSHHRSRTAMP